MINSIEYQSPLPAGYQLRYLVNEQSAHISRDPPRSGLLWTEACVPLILLVSCGIFAVMIRRWVAGLNLARAISAILYFIGYGLLAFSLFINVRRAWQNVGIVMEIAVSADTLYWRKQNVWGSTERFWPLTSIDGVTVQNRLLKVHRRRGPALAAFSFVRAEERQYACDLLNAAIARHRHSQSKPD